MKTGRRSLLAVLLLSTLVSSTIPVNAFAQTSNPTQGGAQTPGQVVADPISGPIRPNDIVRVVVLGAEYATGEFRVETDGTLSVPRVGAVAVGGKSQGDAAQLIGTKMKSLKLLKVPEVTVYIVGRKAREAILSGAITFQGRQVLRDGTLLSDILEAATPVANADLSRIQIRRGSQLMQVDYKAFRNGASADLKNNPSIADGDRVYVFAAEPNEGAVRIIGEVKETDKPVLSIVKGTTVGQVLQMVGITDFSDRKGIYVQRADKKLPAPYDEILAGKDFALQDKDELHVPKMERPKIITVNGAVNQPGQFPLNSKTTLIQAIGQARGLNPGAKRKEIMLRRTDTNGMTTSLKLNLEKDADASTELQDGDFVDIPFGTPGKGFDFNQALGTATGLIFLFSQFKIRL